MTLKLLITLGLLHIGLSAESIQHNGYTYKTVKSPHNGRIWLDRNIGASRVCQSLQDEKCYGDYFQWGRNADGHEKKETVDTIVTDEQAKSIVDVGSQFIKATDENNYDWAHKIDPSGKKRQANWSKTDGSSVCPRGFRVPTMEELENVAQGHRNFSGLNNFLLLSLSGSVTDGFFGISNQDRGRVSHIWSNTLKGNESVCLTILKARSYSSDNVSKRYSGNSVRCIKD